MTRYFIMILMLALLTLTACTDKTDDTSEEKENPEDKVEIKNEDNNNATKTNESKKNNEIENYPEYQVLQEEIEATYSLTPKVEVDNSNKRVILFSDENGNKSIKTIYIKHEKRLKIISLQDEHGELFNDIIDE